MAGSGSCSGDVHVGGDPPGAAQTATISRAGGGRAAEGGWWWQWAGEVGVVRCGEKRKVSVGGVPGGASRGADLTGDGCWAGG